MYPRGRRALELGLPVFTALSFIGCASSVETSTKALSEVQPCCTSRRELPPPEQVYFDQTLRLQPSSPHFDFGLGLAPFVRLSLLPASKKVLEIRAASRPGGTFGDGTFHFPDVRLIFLDAQQQELPHAPPLTASIQDNAFVSTIAVPGGAAQVIVTTAPTTAGERKVETRETRSATLAVGGVVISTPKSTSTAAITLVPYGTIYLRVFGAPPRP